MRKHLLKYDDVMNMQREVVYDRRGYYLEAENLSEEAEEKVDQVVNDMVDARIQDGDIPENWAAQELFLELEGVFLADFTVDESEYLSWDKDLLRNTMQERARARLVGKADTLPGEVYQQVLRYALLRSLDEGWKEHLLELDNLKSGIGLRAYAQKDPLVEFKSEAFSLFEELMLQVDRDALNMLFHMEVAVQKPAAYEGEDLSKVQTQHDDSGGFTKIPESETTTGQGSPPAATAISATGARPNQAKSQPVKAEEKGGRNDPCPCGSGKKYKKCHGANIE